MASTNPDVEKSPIQSEIRWNQKRYRISSTMHHGTAGVLHTLFRIVSDKRKHENKAIEKTTTQKENSKWILICPLSKGIYGYLFEPFADIFASAQLVHLKGKSAQTTSQWSKWGGTRWSPEIVTQNWIFCFFWGSLIWTYLCKLEWSGKGTAVAREWPVLQYKNTRQFQRRSSQISG